MPRTVQSPRWIKSPPHTLGLVVAALVLAAPLARAEETPARDVEHRVGLLEGRIKELESQVRGPGTKESGLIPGVLIGPRLSLLSLPTPTLGGEAKILRYLGVSFDYGFLPKITVSDLTVSYDMWNVAARVYPFGKVFFIGAVYGHYGMTGAAAGAAGAGSAHVSSTFVGPQIGGRWIQPSGFFTALDLAWGFPLSFSSEATRADARRLAENLGTDFRELPINEAAEDFDAILAESFAGRNSDLTEENLQARIRGVLLMALSNKFGWLVVATGNKSELSVGYATLYGDMAGGFALLKDVFKTDVFRLARHLNERAGKELIPATIIERAPSAELRDDQLDEDSLPPYAALDRVLEAYVEQDRSREELSQDGFDPDVVERALALIDRAEYKRRQAPPGVRLTPKAFGRDRRTPITNRWRG